MSHIVNHYQTLIEALLAHQNTNNKGITFIKSSAKSVFLSYQELYQKALQLLHILQCSHIMPGNEVILQIDQAEFFIVSFWACILGGYIPVPLAVKHNEDNYNKLFNIWQRLNNPYWLTTGITQSEFIRFSLATNHPIYHTVKHQMITLDPQFPYSTYGRIYPSRPTDLAFIQYSSGSTGNPKGIMLNHYNLLTNIAAIKERTNITNLDRILSWQPLTHDMGLIGMHLLPLAYGCEQYILPTSLFIRKPLLWLTIASEHQINILSSPNFGINLFLHSFDLKADYHWDLSRVRLIVNGAEPINYKLCAAFLNSLKKYQLNPTVMYPVYGLAEATLGVAFPDLNENCLKYVNVNRNQLAIGDQVECVNNEPVNGITLLEVGFPVKNCNIKILDLKSQELLDNTVGCIYIKGENVTNGYYNDPLQTAQIINSEGWLNTGDLGFIHHGKLVITGREKNLIKINGQSYYSFDIERTAEELPEIKAGKIAVCNVDNPLNQNESHCVFIVFKRKLEEFIPIQIKLKQHIQNKMGITLQNFIPIPSIPMTTSGKIKHHQLALNYQNGNYTLIIQQMNELLSKYNHSIKKRDDSLSGIENNLREIVRRILKADQIDSNFNISEYGIDSAKIIQFQDQVESLYPNLFTITDFYRTATIYGISSIIYHRLHHQKTQNYFAYDIEFRENSIQQLSRLANHFQTDLNSLLLGAYLYLIKELFNSPFIQIYIQKCNRFIPFELDFRLFNHFQEIFRQLQKIESNGSIQSLIPEQLNEANLVYIGDNEAAANFSSLNCGLILRIESHADHFWTRFKSHRKVLDQENVQYLAESYHDLLQQLIEKNELYYRENVL